MTLLAHIPNLTIKALATSRLQDMQQTYRNSIQQNPEVFPQQDSQLYGSHPKSGCAVVRQATNLQENQNKFAWKRASLATCSLLEKHISRMVRCQFNRGKTRRCFQHMTLTSYQARRAICSHLQGIYWESNTDRFRRMSIQSSRTQINSSVWAARNAGIIHRRIPMRCYEV